MYNTHMYMVVSYVPIFGEFAKVLMNGIYTTMEEAVERQTQICGGSIEPMRHLRNNSMYGENGRITWIKTITMGDLQQIDIYSPDPMVPGLTH